MYIEIDSVLTQITPTLWQDAESLKSTENKNGEYLGCFTVLHVQYFTLQVRSRDARGFDLQFKSEKTR
jgi:hypothetical protein